MRAGLRDVEEGAKEAVQASKSPLAKLRSPLADLGIARHQPSDCHPRYILDGQVRDARDTMTLYFPNTCCETQTCPFVGVVPWAHMKLWSVAARCRDLTSCHEYGARCCVVDMEAMLLPCALLPLRDNA